MSLDLLDKLISDIVAVTHSLIDSDPVDTKFLQPSAARIEKQHGSSGYDAKHRHQGRRPMSMGVHRSVC